MWMNDKENDIGFIVFEAREVKASEIKHYPSKSIIQHTPSAMHKSCEDNFYSQYQ